MLLMGHHAHAVFASEHIHTLIQINPAHRGHQTAIRIRPSSVALRAGSYRGNPMAAYRPHPIRAEHFSHWLALWRETTHDMLDKESAGRLCDYAERIGRGLRLGLGLHEHPQGRPFGIPIVGITH
jgi:truncated hemoglobin YjbI